MLEAEATTMLTLLLALGAADPAPLATTIRDVTLYGDSALVHRTGAVHTRASSG